MGLLLALNLVELVVEVSLLLEVVILYVLQVKYSFFNLITFVIWQFTSLYFLQG